MAAIAGYGGSVLITGTSTALSLEPLTDQGDHKTFNESNTARRYWDPSATFFIQTSPDGSTWSSATVGTYTIRYVSGQVVLNAALSGTLPSVRVFSGAYLPTSTLGNVTSWEAVTTGAMLDNTVMGAGRWMTFQPGISGGNVKIAQFFLDATFFNLLATQSNNLFVTSLLTGRTTTERFEGFSRQTQDDVKLDVKQLITENLSMTFTGQLYYFP
jgi:hypothetical protein